MAAARVAHLSEELDHGCYAKIRDALGLVVGEGRSCGVFVGDEIFGRSGGRVDGGVGFGLDIKHGGLVDHRFLEKLDEKTLLMKDLRYHKSLYDLSQSLAPCYMFSCSVLSGREEA